MFFHFMDLIKLYALGLDMEKKILNFNNKTPGQTTPVSVLAPKEKKKLHSETLFTILNDGSSSLSHFNISFFLLFCPIKRKISYFKG